MEETTAQNYFTHGEWEDIPDYEKGRLNTKMEHFYAMQKLGFNPCLPDFVLEWTARTKAASATAKMEPIKQAKSQVKMMSFVTEIAMTKRKRKGKVAVDQNDSSKRAMLEQEVQADANYMEIVDHHINTVEKLRGLVLMVHHEFHGFSVEDVASSQEVAARLKALLKDLEAQYKAACLAHEEAKEALHRKEWGVLFCEDLLEAFRHEEAVDGEQLAAAKAQEQDLSEPRYPHRQRPEVNYAEPKLQDEDEFLICDQCQAEHQGVCPTHARLQFVVDWQLPIDYSEADRVEGTLPQVLALGESSIKGAGLGVWTCALLPGGLVFGPFEGVRLRELDSSGPSGCRRIIERASKVVAKMDAAESSISTWMRYVNCAAYKAQQNVMPFQFQGRLYFRTLREVPAYTELMIYYGDNYARQHGIDTHAYHHGSMSLAPPVVFGCSQCKSAFTSPIQRDYHKQLSCWRRRLNEPEMKALPDVEPLARLDPVGHDLSAELEEPKPVDSGDSSNSTDNGVIIKHLATTHADGRNFACHDCAYKAKRKNALAIHLLTHGGVKPFACAHCNFRAVHKGSVRTHMRKHTGEKPFKCHLCHSKFTQKGNLDSHVRSVHTKERPFGCSQCEYTCVRSDHLARHVLKHSSKMKPSNANGSDKCNDKQKVKASMSSHQKTKKTFACLQCEFCCNLPGQMWKHIAAKHPAK